MTGEYCENAPTGGLAEPNPVHRLLVPDDRDPPASGSPPADRRPLAHALSGSRSGSSRRLAGSL